jgi:hypothetical protein
VLALALGVHKERAGAGGEGEVVAALCFVRSVERRAHAVSDVCALERADDII